MFAKAAASASVPVIKGGVYLDSFDAKFIQYKAALMRLTEIMRLLKVLENSLSKNTKEKTIIPLMNYILTLCQGPLYNVSPVLRKRLELLSEFKLVKLNDVNPVLSTAPIDLTVEFPEVVEDAELYKGKLYDAELQQKLLKSLVKITQNASLIYNKKIRQIVMERNANRPADISGRPVPLDEASVEDLLQPAEVTIALDLAVLITDFDNDTTFKYYHKLTLQVLTKFKEHMNEKVLPAIRNYQTALRTFSKAKGINYSKAILNLPYWQNTMHRVFSLLLRVKYLLDITKALVRQLYIPNREFLHQKNTMLLSKNVYEYQELLKKLEIVCFESDLTKDITEKLELYSKQGSMFPVQANNIIDAYNNGVSKAMIVMKTTLQHLDTWCLIWKFVQENSLSENTLAGLTDEELTNMLEERLAVDRLTYTEELNKKEELKKQRREIINTGAPAAVEGSVKTIFRRNSVRDSNASPSSQPSSSTSSPGKMSPAKLSRTSSETKRFPLQLKNSNAEKRSPQVSRRASISERSSQNTMKLSTSENSPQISRKPSISRTTGNSTARAGRKRSSSLQSAVAASSTPNKPNSRANSLQTNATLNQRMVQATFKKLSGNLSGSSENKQNRFLSPLTAAKGAKRSSSPSPLRRQKNSPLPSPSVQPSDPKAEEAPDMNALSLDENTLVVSSSVPQKIANKVDGVMDNHADNDDESTAAASMESTRTNSSESVEQAIDNSTSSSTPSISVPVKKVRFAGVPPMTNSENPKPKRRGWYKKPTVLHYPPPPPQVAVQQFKLRQEGLAFRTSLRETEPEGSQGKKSSMLMNLEQPSTGHASRITSRIREKLIR